jgi:hypothetical protein
VAGKLAVSHLHEESAPVEPGKNEAEENGQENYLAIRKQNFEIRKLEEEHSLEIRKREVEYHLQLQQKALEIERLKIDLENVKLLQTRARLKAESEDRIDLLKQFIKLLVGR